MKPLLIVPDPQGNIREKRGTLTVVAPPLIPTHQSVVTFHEIIFIPQEKVATWAF